MKRIYVRIKLGYLGDEEWYDTNNWVQISRNETPEHIAQRVSSWVQETAEELINDDEGDEENE